MNWALKLKRLLYNLEPSMLVDDSCRRNILTHLTGWVSGIRSEDYCQSLSLDILLCLFDIESILGLYDTVTVDVIQKIEH